MGFASFSTAELCLDVITFSALNSSLYSKTLVCTLVHSLRKLALVGFPYQVFTPLMKNFMNPWIANELSFYFVYFGVYKVCWSDGLFACSYIRWLVRRSPFNLPCFASLADRLMVVLLLFHFPGLFRAIFILDDTRFLKVSLEPLYSLVFIFVWGYFLESMASLLWTTLPYVYCQNYDQYRVR